MTEPTTAEHQAHLARLKFGEPCGCISRHTGAHHGSSRDAGKGFRNLHGEALGQRILSVRAVDIKAIGRLVRAERLTTGAAATAPVTGIMHPGNADTGAEVGAGSGPTCAHPTDAFVTQRQGRRRAGWKRRSLPDVQVRMAEPRCFDFDEKLAMTGLGNRHPPNRTACQPRSVALPACNWSFSPPWGPLDE